MDGTKVGKTSGENGGDTKKKIEYKQEYPKLIIVTKAASVYYTLEIQWLMPIKGKNCFISPG